MNGYHKNAGADPVDLDPEAVALANYRAWTDAEYNLYAHDWTTDRAYSDEVNDVQWRLSRDHFAENTVKWYSTSSKGHGMFAIYYANSERHYLLNLIPYLSAYMGHSDYKATQYYLRLTAEIYPEMVEMLAAECMDIIPPGGEFCENS